MVYDRRTWLQQSLTAIAATALSTDVIARTAQVLMPTTKGTILLNSNENPYGPSPMAQHAMLQQYRSSNRYPDDYLLLLKKKIAAHWNVQPENILLGAGSSEIIGLSCLMASKKNKKVVTAEPGYKVWNSQAASFGLEFESIPLNKEKVVDLQSMLDAVTAETAMVYVCNPNNPTGTFTSVESLKNFATAASKKTTVFIDEAYTEYANLPSLAAEAVANPNLIVAKTFSKVYGLAGARVGYAIAHLETVAKLAALQPWADGAVSIVSAAAAMASLEDTAYVKGILLKTAQARAMCTDTFKQLHLDFIPSNTNFILFNIDNIKKDCIKEMEARNIFVQSRNHFNGQWCRVSMGTIEEMKIFCAALKEIAS